MVDVFPGVDPSPLVTLTGPSPPSSARPGEADDTLQRSDAGVDSALLYAKAWSKYTKELLAWVDRRLAMDIECAKSYAKMAESAKNLACQQEFMAFREIYVSAFKNDMEYSQLLLHTAAVLQSNKFTQPLQARKCELDKLRKEVKEQWQREQKRMLDSRHTSLRWRLRPFVPCTALLLPRHRNFTWAVPVFFAASPCPRHSVVDELVCFAVIPIEATPSFRLGW
ncbi:hypothetical protein NHX12_021622 [Muraenolepis orangiensis]|uniref:F-BAR domain-containing protein n=1 Tax=Muraenolepis orangiensis TaxID=630683 RepID=A0A9Q0ISI6_9TELE|nr:hypothetical protein NHX12_021622 [Muraenolepis orangiensis]